jgi:hypothetical protein
MLCRNASVSSLYVPACLFLYMPLHLSVIARHEQTWYVQYRLLLWFSSWNFSLKHVILEKTGSVCLWHINYAVSRIKLMTAIRSVQEGKGNQCCVLMLWPVMSGAPIMQCGAQDADYQVEVMTVYCLLMQSSCALFRAFNSSARGLRHWTKFSLTKLCWNNASVVTKFRLFSELVLIMICFGRPGYLQVMYNIYKISERILST